MAEFGDKGYAGARVGEIAARAGVNVQLISYYFGGKAGLYRELTARWRLTSAELSGAGSLAEVVAGFARVSLQQRDWTRLLLWDGLTEPPAEPGATRPAPPADGEPDFLLARPWRTCANARRPASYPPISSRPSCCWRCSRRPAPR